MFSFILLYDQKELSPIVLSLAPKLRTMKDGSQEQIPFVAVEVIVDEI